MKSIFELENRLDIQHEFSKFIKILHQNNQAVQINPYGNWTSFINAIDKKVFKKWKYRDTILTVKEYLNFIGIEKDIYAGAWPISKEIFLYYLEFILNMIKLLDETYGIYQCDEEITAIIENIPIILEKMNYISKEVDDKIIITKRDADMDSILTKVPGKIANILLEYNDFRIRGDVEAKKKILKDIDLYIEKNINVKSFDRDLDNSIGFIINKMGVNHPIIEEPYTNISNEELIKWYDKCFLMMIHAIRTVEVNKIKSERKELLNN